MRHDELIGQVQARARLASRGEAERATAAVLTTLAERLTGGLAENIAAQLPTELGDHLRRSDDTPVTLGWDDFVDRVVERAGGDRPAAVHHIRAVLEVVDEATTGRLMDHVRDELPAEFERVLAAGSQGRLPRDG